MRGGVDGFVVVWERGWFVGCSVMTMFLCFRELVKSCVRLKWGVVEGGGGGWILFSCFRG